MSFGLSNSTGKETNRNWLTGTQDSHASSKQAGKQAFSNTSTQSVALPAWARAGNRELFEGRKAGESDAREFLMGLLTDPYSGSGEGAGDNRFAVSLRRMFDSALARARGTSTTSGTARAGYREGEALAGAQDAAVRQGMDAANSLLTNANPFAALDFARASAPVTTTSSGQSTSLQDLVNQAHELTKQSQVGTTAMSASNVGGGFNLCCFVFMEHFRGKGLPRFVRRCRDEFASGPRVEGYRKMAKHIVPLMRVSRIVRWLVNLLLIAPLCGFGGWLYSQPGVRYRFGWLMTPFVVFWFMLWAVMGRTINFEPHE